MTKILTKLVSHERRTAFESLLQGRELAIVGNAPTEVGSGHGQEIDSADLVVRFNRYSISEEHAINYGTRTDIWVTCLSAEVPFNPTMSDWICCPLALTSLNWLRRYKATDRKALFQALNIGGIFPTKIEFERLIQEVPTPSTGISFLHFITQCMSEPARFKLYGFSFFDRSSSHHYFEKYKGAMVHDGNRERKYFEEKIKDHCLLRDTTTKPRSVICENTKRTK